MLCNGFFKLTRVKVIIVTLFVLVNILLYVQSKNVIMETVFRQFDSNSSFSSGFQALTHFVSDPNSNISQKNETMTPTGPPFLQEPIINPHNFNYLIQPNVSCSNRTIELAICVVITHDNHIGRTVVRETWGNYSKDPGNNAVLVFFVGSNGDFTNNSQRIEKQRKIQEESFIYGDIVQEDFIDAYVNLSIKSVSVLKWIKLFCPEAKFVLKIDDDMYANIPLLMTKILKGLDKPSPNAFVVGSMQLDARPIRNEKSKWYTPLSLYKGSTYPDYVSGTSYSISREAVSLLYEASLRVPTFWLEDVYITGLCSKKAGVKVIHSGYFAYWKPRASGCTFKAHFSGHRYTHEEIRQIHKELYDPKLSCR
jgi:beta-1,3-galactosyltransferase 1